MKSMFQPAGFLLAVVLVSFLAIASALGQDHNEGMPRGIQRLTTNDCPTSIYEVQERDVLWNLYGEKWRLLIAGNPDLPGRVTQRGPGDVLALIFPGDMLCIPEGMEVSDFVTTTEPAALADAAANPQPTTGTHEIDNKAGFGWLSWLLLGALVALGVGILFWLIWPWVFAPWIKRRQRREARELEREMAQDPVRSGPPVVPGGIRPNEVDRLNAFFQDCASAQYLETHPGADIDRVERISPIERGMISGDGMVGYDNGARPRHIDPPLPGYRSRFRFPDGSERELMSLQGCMNPVYAGEGLSGFLFTPRAIVVETPAPSAPEPRPVPESAAPVIIVSGGFEYALESGRLELNPDGSLKGVTVPGFRMTIGNQPRLSEVTMVNHVAETEG